MKNRRKHLRTPTAMLCDVFDPDTGKVKGSVVNFSLDGLGLVTTVLFQKGHQVTLHVRFKTRRVIIRGIVVYLNQIMQDVYSYGIKYINLNILKKIRLKKAFECTEKEMKEALEERVTACKKKRRKICRT